MSPVRLDICTISSPRLSVIIWWMRIVRPLGRHAEGSHTGLHARHVALVVGAPDVDDAVEVAQDELVVVVGDVGGEVGRDAVAAHQHVVLVLAQRAR